MFNCIPIDVVFIENDTDISLVACNRESEDLGIIELLNRSFPLMPENEIIQKYSEFINNVMVPKYEQNGFSVKADNSTLEPSITIPKATVEERDTYVRMFIKEFYDFVGKLYKNFPEDYDRKIIFTHRSIGNGKCKCTHLDPISIVRSVEKKDDKYFVSFSFESTHGNILCNLLNRYLISPQFAKKIYDEIFINSKLTDYDKNVRFGFCSDVEGTFNTYEDIENAGLKIIEELKKTIMKLESREAFIQNYICKTKPIPDSDAVYCIRIDPASNYYRERYNCDYIGFIGFCPYEKFLYAKNIKQNNPYENLLRDDISPISKKYIGSNSLKGFSCDDLVNTWDVEKISKQYDDGFRDLFNELNKLLKKK